MYICICNAITDKQIRESGVLDLWQLQRDLGVASGCGACRESASEILREERQRRKAIDPVVYHPAVA